MRARSTLDWSQSKIFLVFKCLHNYNSFLLTNIFNSSRKYKPRALQKRPLHPIHVGVHECNLRLGKQKSQLLL